MQRTACVLAVWCALAVPAGAQPISWEPFTFEAPVVGPTNAERGWLDVPVYHGRQDGGRIRLPVVRIKTTNPNPGPPIVFLAGGPGNAGTRILTGALHPHAARMSAYADIIALDQRGTGASEPSLTVPGRFDLPSDVSLDSAEARQRIAALGNTIRAAMASRGIDLSAYNTVESADDVELLRRALGAEKIALWAHSYGTHLALAFIKRYGDRVQRALLGGVNGLDDRWREPTEGDTWTSRVGAAMQSNAPGGRAVDFVSQVKRVLTHLEREPLRIKTADGEVLVAKDEVQLLVTLQSGDLEFVQNLPVLFDSLAKRTELDAIATAVQQVIRRRPIGTAMTYAMHVASGVSAQRAARIREQAPTAIFGNAINWGIGDEQFVKALGVPSLGDDFRAPFRSDVPVLLISGTLDGRTSEADARRAGAQFRQANYLTLDGASHDFFFRRPPVRFAAVIDAFLSGQPVPDERIVWPVSFKWPE